MIEFKNVTIRFGGADLFNDASLLIQGKEKVGLAGKNGAGKSTLLKLVANQLTPSEGVVTLAKDSTVGYLPQQMAYEDNTTIFEEAKKAFEYLLSIEKEIDALNQQILIRTDYESVEYTSMLDRLNELNDKFLLNDGQNIDGQVEKTLIGLGFTLDQFNMSTSRLSGGWRMRVELAKLLLQSPDILLLDEPTNHLDIESIQWLENFLTGYNGIVLLVSHDRTFLDTITSRTIEINAGKIHDYKAPYSKFLKLREERREQQIAAYKNQQKLISETQSFIDRFRYKATKSNQVQSRIKNLEKLDKIEIDEIDTSKINIHFPEAPRSGSIVAELKGLSKSYGDKEVLEGIDLIIERGEKIAFVGKNGEGKTTLARIINGELDFNGVFKPGHNVNIGYFAQNQDEILDENKTVLETLSDIAVGDVRTKLRDILGSFLFSDEDVDKKVKVLSGGERSRLALAKLMLEPYNFLILDEPTNHLDIPSKDMLKQALIKYNGTAVIVSHDRYFLNELTDKILEFKNKGIKEYTGGIQYFIESRKIQNLEELNISVKDSENKSKEIKNGKIDFEQRKEINRKIKKVQNQLMNVEELISTLEYEIESMNKQLENPEMLSNADFSAEEFFKEYNLKKMALNEQLSNWEALSVQLEQMKNEKPL